MGGMPSNQEMTISKSRAEVIFRFAITAIVVFFVLLAIVNFCSGLALIASSAWLALVMWIIWEESRREGGFRGFLISQMGDLFGRRFTKASPADAQPKDVCFGFDLLGHRFIQQCFPIDSIESVEWRPGQATGMAGRDMNDWTVFIWFDHHDPETSEKQKRRKHRKPYQKIYCVGPSTRKERTEALGLSLVAFLRDAGADLVPADIPDCFARRERDAGEMKSIQSGAPPNGGPKSASGDSGAAEEQRADIK
jgi:hypothetical protein